MNEKSNYDGQNLKYFIATEKKITELIKKTRNDCNFRTFHQFDLFASTNCQLLTKPANLIEGLHSSGVQNIELLKKPKSRLSSVELPK